MPVGIIILFLIGILIYLGTAQRVLDRLYLSDTTALVIVVLIIAGSFVNPTIISSPLVKVNFGGAVIPVVLALYVLFKAGTYKEVIRTIVAIVATTGAIYAISRLFQDFGHGRDIIDPMYIFALSGGIIAYLLGRSRRGAFVAGTLGFFGYNLIHLWRVLSGRVISQVNLGGAGAFDGIVISGILAVLLAEIVGESRERIMGGPERGNNRPGKGGENNEK